MKISKKTRLKIVLDGQTKERNITTTSTKRNAVDVYGDGIPRVFAGDVATKDHEHTGT